MKRFTKFVYALVFIISSSAFGEQVGTSGSGQPDITPQTMSGFKPVPQDKKSDFQKFEFRNDGQFLISKQGFSTRQEAIDFCKKQTGFELSDWRLPGVMAMSALPFDDLKKNNVIDDKILSGKDTLSGSSRSGVIFWTQGSTEEEKSRLAGKSDAVYEMLNGCGPMCDGVESLSAINTRLAKKGKPALKIQAICVSKDLQKKLSE